MVMVPIYAISSLIALFSLEAAFVIDAIRDIYEVRQIRLRKLGNGVVFAVLLILPFIQLASCGISQILEWPCHFESFCTHGLSHPLPT